MIGSVLILFKIVTAYGESQIKAPNKISGSYQLEIQNSPNCLDSNNLILQIEQSGIYLFGQLILGSDSVQQSKHPKAAENPVNKINLNGQFKENKILLTGDSNHFLNCLNESNNPSKPLLIQSIANEKILSGKITWNAIETNFKAYLKTPTSKENKSE
jgi:hypothetical protein